MSLLYICHLYIYICHFQLGISQVPVEVTLVWQLVEAIASAYEAYKICHFVGLKKRKKVTAIVCVFYEKRRRKKEPIEWNTLFCKS